MKCQGIIGPDNAGQSTLLDLIYGCTKADSGSVNFNGRYLSRMAPPAPARRTDQPHP